jgi:hypothetical protein
MELDFERLVKQCFPMSMAGNTDGRGSADFG